MIFTTFTVIFLPLSFFTSLFGMNTAEWSGDDDNFVSLRTITAISLPASAAIVGASLVLAFSSRVQGFFTAALRALRAAADAAARGLRRLLVEPFSAASSGAKGREKKRARIAREQLERRRLRRRERGYDFWETVRLEGGSRYEIPELNRKGPTRFRLAGRDTWRRMVKEDW